MSKNSTARFLAITLTLSLSASCGPRAATETQAEKRARLLLSEWEPSGRQTCNIHVPEGGIPAVDAFVDSAGLHRDVKELWQESGAEPGRALLSIPLEPDSTGKLKPPVLIEDDLPPSVAAELLATVDAHLQPPASAPRRVRLEVRGGPTPAFRAGATETCRPVLKNPNYLSKRLTGYAQQIGRSGDAVVSVFINTQGKVMEAEIRESSGDQAIDQAALALAYEMEFLPALNDRVPVPVWVVVPVSVSAG